MNDGPIYAHRASKDVTRKIFLDMLRQFDLNGHLKKYQYVGFGALEFIDFDLIHCQLGINDLYSIEKRPIERFEANKPYKCIELLHGQSTDMLTQIKWNKLSIVWLDYESTLNDRVLTDIKYLCQKLLPGSILAVTLNAHPGPLEGRRERLGSLIGESRLPPMTTDNTLGDWGWAQAQQRVVFSTIRNQLGKRNDNASWWQVLNINYRDNAQMQLIAGIISSPVLEPRLSTSGLPELDYYQPDSRALEVSIPYLTPHEQRILRRSLPRPRQRRWPKLVGVGEATVKQYAGFYRWIDAN